MKLKRTRLIKTLLAGLAGAVATTGLTVSASTVAHYRFEDGAAGNAAGSAVDSSGNDYHLENIAGEPLFTDEIPAAEIPRTGDGNTLAADFAQENADENTNNAFAGSDDDGLSQVDLTDFTLEAWVRYDATGGPQTIVGRDDAGGEGDGFNTDSNHALLYFQSNNTGFRIEVVTDQGELISANSSVVPEAEVWYHVAAVGDAAAGTLTLYVDGVAAAETDGFTGLAAPSDPATPWTIGRGQWAGDPGDWLSGQVDEVRISDAALPVNEFLNIAPDEFRFTSHPDGSTLWAGSDVTFEAEFIAGADADVSLQWEVSEDGGDTWNAVSGETETSYTITGATADLDRNRYRLAATVDGQSFASEPALLRVGAGDPVVPEGVVAHYRFEEGPDGAVANQAVDSIGGHNMDVFIADDEENEPIYTSEVPVSQLPATADSNAFALDFSEGAYAFEGESLNQFDFQDFTFEAWVNHDDVGGAQTYLGRDDLGGEGEGYWQDTNNALLYFQNHWDGNDFRVHLATDEGTFIEVTTGFTPQANVWYHVAAVGDSEAGTLSFYVDGQLVGSTDGYTGMLVPDGEETPWTIGRGQWEGNPVDYLNGQMDELRISNAALSPVEFLNFNAAVLAFLTQPEDVIAAAGQDVIFTSLAGGGQGELTYQWEVSTDGGETWNVMDGETSPDLLLESVGVGLDGNQYRVIVTRGDDTEISNVATLEVPSYPDPVITQDLQPGPLVLVGDSFTYTVAATGDGNISYQWQKDGVDLDGETGSSLTLEDITLEDAGEYSVIVEDDAALQDGLEPASVTVTSILAVAPRVQGAISLNFVGAGSGEWGSSDQLGIIQPNETAGALPVGNWNNSAEVDNVSTQTTPIELMDDAGESTTATATWNSANTWSANADAQLFLGDPDQRLFHGYIETRAEPGDTEEATTVTIEGIPYDTYDVYVYPMGVEDESGTAARTVTLEDEAEDVRQKYMRNFLGAPTPSEIPYILSHSTSLEDAVETPAATYFRFEGVSGSSIVLQHFDLDSEGWGWNSGGFAGVSIVDRTENVPARPGIVEGPANQFVPGGDDVTFSVQAESFNPGGELSYQWQHDGQNIAGETGTSLTVEDVSFADSGEYTVVVTDSSDLGTSVTSSTANLLVVDEGRPALLNVDVQVIDNEAEGNPPNEPMVGDAMLRPSGLVEFQYPADFGDNPMGIGEGDTLWSPVTGLEGDNNYHNLSDHEGLLLPGLTLSINGAAGAVDEPDFGGLEDLSDPESYSAPLMRDYVFAEDENEMSVTLGGLQAFAGREVTLVVYAVGLMSEFDEAHDSNDNATVTLAEANNYLGLDPITTRNQEEGREVRWNEESFAAFEARIASDGTLSWTVGPDPDEPGVNAMTGFQLLLTNEGEPPDTTPIEDWRQTHFGTTENTGDAANDADFDGDGFQNLMKYALGADPTVPGSAHGLVTQEMDGDVLTLTFEHIADTSLTYHIEATDDLSGEWTVVETYEGFPSAGTQTYVDDVPVGQDGQRFLRLSVSINQ